MEFEKYAKYLRESYERGEYVPDNYEDLEAFLSLDPSERQYRVMGSYANEDMYDQAMEEGAKLWQEEN